MKNTSIKKLFLLFLLYSYGSQAMAQSGLSYEWVKAIDPSEYGWVKDHAIDDFGNIYTTGHYAGSFSDFDPGPGTATLGYSSFGGSAIFLAKYDDQGNYIFAKKIYPGWQTTALVNAIAVGPRGGVYIVGSYVRSVNIDGLVLSNSGTRDIFIAKFNSTTGNVIDAISLGAGEATDIVTDNSGNIFVTGHFYGTNDFDPSGNQNNLTSAGGSDVFIAKYNSSLQYQFARRIGGPGNDKGTSLALFSCKLYVAGEFEQTIFVGSSGGFVPIPRYLTSEGNTDIFWGEYSCTSGSYVRSKRIGGTDNDRDALISVDDFYGNVYVAGTFESSVDFNIGGNTLTLNAQLNGDMFFAKYDNSANCIYAKQTSGGTKVRDIVAADYGELYLTGNYIGTNDFNPGSNSFNLTAIGDQDIFVAKYDRVGSFQYAEGFGRSNESSYGYSISLYDNDIYLAGSSIAGADFDPDTGIATFQNLSWGYNSKPFFAKYSEDNSVGAIHLDGVNDYLVCSQRLPSNGDSWSLEFWTNPETVNNGGDGQLLFGQLSYTSNFFTSYFTAGSFRVMERNGFYIAILDFSVGARTLNLGAATANEWAHLAFSYDESTQEISAYKNGVLEAVGSTVNISPQNIIARSSRMGYAVSDEPLLFRGKIDEVRVWDYPLCQREIELRINCELTGSETGLQSYFDFNNPNATFSGPNFSQTTVAEKSGNSTPATLVNLLLNSLYSNWTAQAITVAETSCGPVYCESYWTGNINNDWDEASNWMGNFKPDTDDDAIIPNGAPNYPEIEIDAEINHISIESNASVHILNGQSLTVNGVLDNEGTFTIESGAALVQGTGSTLAGSGTYHVERNIPGPQTFFGSPISNQAVGGFGIAATGTNGGQVEPDASNPCNPTSVDPNSPYGNIMEVREDATPISNCGQSLWFVKSVGSLDNGRGYVVNSTATTLDFSGTVNNGAITYTGLTRQTGNIGTQDGSNITMGWHLVANPYPSPIALSSADLLAMGFDGQINLYNSVSGTWVSYINTTVDIAVGQGFQIRKTNVGGTSDFVLDNTYRTIGNPQYYKQPNSLSQALNITLDNGAVIDQHQLYFINGATEHFDPQYDANKLMGVYSNPLLYTIADSQRLSYNAYAPMQPEEEKTVPLGVHAGADGRFTLQFNGIDDLEADVWLEDLQLDTTVSLTEAYTYAFTALDADMNERFLLHFHKHAAPEEPQDTSSIQEEEVISSIDQVDAENIVLFPNPTEANITLKLNQDHSYNKAVVYDVTGKEKLSMIVSQQANVYELNTAELSKGVYFLRLSGVEHNTTLKFIKQ